MKAIVFTFALLISGCTSPGSYCAVYTPIHDHPNDTAKTREQILDRNAKWVALCDKFPNNLWSR